MTKFNPGGFLGLMMLAGVLAFNSGCSKNTKAETGEIAEPVPERSSGGISTEGVEDRSLEGIEQDRRAAFNDPNSPLYVRTYYFDFDSDVVKPEYERPLDAHADYIKKSRSRLTIRLEGHADERGSREYNIGLGERRGNAIKKALLLRGVPADQLAVLSYGEERPADPGHDEGAWAKNRRVELVYPRQ